MTAKEKAFELVEKFDEHTFKPSPLFNPNFKEPFYHSKQCALLCVDEIIEQWEYIDTYLADLSGTLNPNLKYWQEVKIEIEKSSWR